MTSGGELVSKSSFRCEFLAAKSVVQLCVFCLHHHTLEVHQAMIFYRLGFWNHHFVSILYSLGLSSSKTHILHVWNLSKNIYLHLPWIYGKRRYIFQSHGAHGKGTTISKNNFQGIGSRHSKKTPTYPLEYTPGTSTTSLWRKSWIIFVIWGTWGWNFQGVCWNFLRSMIFFWGGGRAGELLLQTNIKPTT